MLVCVSTAAKTTVPVPVLTESPSAVTHSKVLPTSSINFSKLKGVLFDIDGTLTHSDPLHLLTYQDILVEVGYNNGVPIDWAFFNAHISGRHNPEICAELFPDWTEERQRWVYETKEERFREMAESVLVEVEGLTAFRDWIASMGLRVAAVTNAPRLNADLMLSALGLSTYFETLVIGEECSKPKPDPEPYLQALSFLSLAPIDTIIIEDSCAGITAGVAAGVLVVGLSTSQAPEKLLAAGADFVVADFAELLQVIKAQG
ncbi:MAG: hypothetical protein WDW38_003041 [Sanguina aurantia]